MAEERTEAPTPKRKEEVRKRGQTARSQDLTTAIVLLAGLYTLKLTAGLILDRLSALLVGHILAAGALDKTAARDPGASGVGALAAILPRSLVCWPSPRWQPASYRVALCSSLVS